MNTSLGTPNSNGRTPLSGNVVINAPVRTIVKCQAFVAGEKYDGHTPRIHRACGTLPTIFRLETSPGSSARHGKLCRNVANSDRACN
jgi:hypothetical protein